MKNISKKNIYILVLLIMIFLNILIENAYLSLFIGLAEIILLLKVILLHRKANLQKELNDKLYRLEGTLQTMKMEKSIPISILQQIRLITGVDFIVYQSSISTLDGICGIGSIHHGTDYREHGGVINYTIKWGRPIFLEEFSKVEKIPFDLNNVSLFKNEKLVTIYSVPLIYNQTVSGGLLFGSRSKFTLTEERKKVITSIVRMLSIYLENKNLHQQIENQATINERRRISGEIHDGLAQSIGFINIQLHRLKKMIINNELEKALQEIDAAKEAVQDSYVELREAIDQLRDISGYNESLSDWIGKYTQDFQRSYGIQICADLNRIDKIQLTEEQRVQITRVIQEIFNNIRKHSNAKKVELKCTVENNVMMLSIEDDGIGFDPEMDYKRKYHGNGLVILKDRIHSIKGNLNIKSTLNKGTKIEIQIPFAV
jgi:signal transduction histidine kinase